MPTSNQISLEVGKFPTQASWDSISQTAMRSFETRDAKLLERLGMTLWAFASEIEASPHGQFFRNLWIPCKWDVQDDGSLLSKKPPCVRNLPSHPFTADRLKIPSERPNMTMVGVRLDYLVVLDVDVPKDWCSGESQALRWCRNILLYQGEATFETWSSETRRTYWFVIAQADFDNFPRQIDFEDGSFIELRYGEKMYQNLAGAHPITGQYFAQGFEALREMTPLERSRLLAGVEANPDFEGVEEETAPYQGEDPPLEWMIMLIWTLIDMRRLGGDRQSWVEVGMILKHHHPQIGFAAWRQLTLEWSAYLGRPDGTSNAQDRLLKEHQAVWDSFKERNAAGKHPKKTIASLIYLYKEGILALNGGDPTKHIRRSLQLPQGELSVEEAYTEWLTQELVPDPVSTEIEAFEQEQKTSHGYLLELARRYVREESGFEDLTYLKARIKQRFKAFDLTLYEKIIIQFEHKIRLAQIEIGQLQLSTDAVEGLAFPSEVWEWIPFGLDIRADLLEQGIPEAAGFFALLIGLSAVLPRGKRWQFLRDRIAKPIFMLVLLGQSGEGKSPILEPFTKYLSDKGLAQFKAHQERAKEWERATRKIDRLAPSLKQKRNKILNEAEEQLISEEQRKDFITKNLLLEGLPLESPDEFPPNPPDPYIFTEGTIESIRNANVATQNHGAVLLVDEVINVFSSLQDHKNKKSDRSLVNSKLIEVLDGANVFSSTIVHGNVIGDWQLSICGTSQPQIFPLHVNLNDPQGTAGRMIILDIQGFDYQPTLVTETETKVKRTIPDLVQDLYSCAENLDRHVQQANAESAALFNTWWNLTRKPTTPGVEKSGFEIWFSKSPLQLVRLAGSIHELRKIGTRLDNIAPDKQIHAENWTEIDVESTRLALQILQYLANETAKLFGESSPMAENGIQVGILKDPFYQPILQRIQYLQTAHKFATDREISRAKALQTKLPMQQLREKLAELKSANYIQFNEKTKGWELLIELLD